MTTTKSPSFDIVVLGGGVVGLSILRSVTLAGWACALVEAEADLLSRASGSNSGIACTGVDASPGTLERALIRDSISQIRLFCREFNIPYRDCGSLVCQWPWDESSHDNKAEAATSSLSHVLEESWNAGDNHATRLSPELVQKREPNLSTACSGAVHIPGEMVLDPWLFSIAFALHAKENGATIYTSFSFDPHNSSFDDKSKIWTIIRACNDHSTAPLSIKAKVVVNATGIYADYLQQHTEGAPAPAWSAAPRRGQYRIFSSNEKTKITCPIQPVPTQRTKGVFVFSTLYNQLVVGPTAMDQSSKTDRAIDPAVAEQLAKHIHRLLPNLNLQEDYVGDYVGIRPGSTRRDYQIHLHANKHWIAAAGIRSTGLTASLGIGRHVTHLLGSILDIALQERIIISTPLPPLEELIADFRNRSTGFVAIHGNLYRVTHPLTRFGWEDYKDLDTTK